MTQIEVAACHYSPSPTKFTTTSPKGWPQHGGLSEMSARSMPRRVAPLSLPLPGPPEPTLLRDGAGRDEGQRDDALRRVGARAVARRAAGGARWPHALARVSAAPPSPPQEGRTSGRRPDALQGNTAALPRPGGLKLADDGPKSAEVGKREIGPKRPSLGPEYRTNVDRV